MKKVYFKYITITITFFTLYACFAIKNQPIKNTEWLIGTWENKTKKGIIYESWVKISKTELSGKSYKIQESDTTIFETIRLIQKEDKLFFIPKVKNQNNNQPIRFLSTFVSKDRMVFENQKHDFPQIISYTKIKKDSLVAITSGMENNKERQIKFAMRKVKE
mgnify:CR=1 FL=1